MRIWIVLAALPATLTVSAQNITERLNEYFTKSTANQQFNGNVLIADKGKIIFEKSYGYADLATKAPNKSSTRFPVGSITKSLTAVGILQLAEQNRLSVNDPVKKYLPGFPYPDIKIINLLSHTSGLPPYNNVLDSVWQIFPDTVFYNRDVLYAFIVREPSLLYKPGEYSNYDNINYLFLSMIIERVAFKAFHRFITENILKPAGMTNSFFPRIAFAHYSKTESLNLAPTYRLAHAYSPGYEIADTINFISRYWKTYNLQGFGELVSTTGDLLKYDAALRNGKLLKTASLKAAYTPVLLNNGQPNKGNNNGSSFGLGWIIDDDQSHGKIVRSSGAVVGLRASLVRNLTNGQTIILIDNTEHETDEIRKDVTRILNGERVNPIGKSAARLYATSISKLTDEQLTDLINSMKKDTVQYRIDENEFNSLGYDFLSNDRMKDALRTFKLNTELFPSSWNVFDSYGEALLKSGDSTSAIKMYQRSIELNPDNQNGKQVLKDLLKN